MSIGKFKEEIIKGRVKYYISSKKDKTKEIETTAKIEKKKIIYKEEDILIKVIKKQNKIDIIRENNKFKHIITFNVNKKTVSEYYIKDMNISLEFNIITNQLINEKDYIYVEYLIEETNEEYEYKLSYKEEI